MSSKIDALMPLIKKKFDAIRSDVSGIERNTEQRERVIKAICDYVTQTITTESKLLLSSFYSLLMDETLAHEPFLNNTKNKNIFYRLDIFSEISGKYNFSISEDIDYRQAHKKYSALLFPAGTIGIGVILSIALSKVIIIPVSLVVAGVLYCFISEQGENKNRYEFKAAINCYLDTVESELCIWLKDIEEFYNKQVEELISTLGNSIDG